MPRHPLDRIPIRMFLYGVALGSLTIEVMSMFYRLSYSQNILFTSLHLLISELFLGTAFGGMAGLLSGIAIFFITKNLLTRHISPPNVHYCRVCSGYITAGITGGILIPLFPISLMLLWYGDALFFITLTISVGIAVYMSQHTITKYLRDIDVRKAKTK